MLETIFLSNQVEPTLAFSKKTLIKYFPKYFR